MTYSSNWTAVTDPDGAVNNSSEGYGPGSQWFNLDTGAFFVCASASIGEATWVQATAA